MTRAPRSADRAARDPDDDTAAADGALAYLRGSIVLVKLDERHRPQIDVRIPVLGPIARKPGDVTEGSFALDLKAELRAPLAAGDYLVYLFAGEYHSGPHAMTVTP